MTQTLASVIFFVVLLALVPVGLKWIQGRSLGSSAALASATRVISAVAVGPHQKIVTVEVGPEGSRVWLTLGVTGQSITCLHSTAIDLKSDVSSLPKSRGGLV